MFKTLIKILCISLLLTVCSCSKPIEQEELFSYPYDFQYYGFDTTKCCLKASTVSTLKKAIEDKQTTLFLISTPTCISCKGIAEIINNIGCEKNITVYNIDPNDSVYPVFSTGDFDVLLDILKEIGINGESEFSTPILLVINKGKIDGYFKDYDYHAEIAYEDLCASVEEVMAKSIFYK